MKPVAPVSAMRGLCDEAGLVDAVPSCSGTHGVATPRSLRVPRRPILRLARHLGEFSSVSRRISPLPSSVKA